MPSALLAEVQAAAREQHRAADELVRDAVERYLHSRRPATSHAVSNEKALAVINRIRELRKGNILPEGVTIRDLISLKS